MTQPHDLYVDLRKTDLLIAELHSCQDRQAARLRLGGWRAWRERVLAYRLKRKIKKLCAHRDALIREAAARQGRNHTIE